MPRRARIILQISSKLRLNADALRAVLREGPREGASERFLLVLPKETPQAPKKSALVLVDR